MRGKSQLGQNPVTRIRFSGAPFNEKAVSGQLSAISKDTFGRDRANPEGERRPPSSHLNMTECDCSSLHLYAVTSTGSWNVNLKDQGKITPNPPCFKKMLRQD
jgi:hypothetical protein